MRTATRAPNDSRPRNGRTAAIFRTQMCRPGKTVSATESPSPNPTDILTIHLSLPRRYSEEIFSQHSRRHSNDSGSELSEHDALPNDAIPSKQATPRRRTSTKADIWSSPTHRKITPTNIDPTAVEPSTVAASSPLRRRDHDDPDPESTVQEVQAFYREKIIEINRQHEESMRILKFRLKRFECRTADDEFMVCQSVRLGMICDRIRITASTHTLQHLTRITCLAFRSVFNRMDVSLLFTLFPFVRIMCLLVAFRVSMSFPPQPHTHKTHACPNRNPTHPPNRPRCHLAIDVVDIAIRIHEHVHNRPTCSHQRSAQRRRRLRQIHRTKLTMSPTIVPMTTTTTSPR